MRVPFGSRLLTGIVLGSTAPSTPPGTELRAVEALLDDEPLLDALHLDLCRWAADYYQHPIGEVLFTGMPKSLREGRALPEHAWRLNARGRGLAVDALARAPKQQAVLAMLRERGVVPADTLREAGISSAVLRQLVQKDLIERCLLHC